MIYHNDDDELQHSSRDNFVQRNNKSRLSNKRSQSNRVLTQKRLASRRDNGIIMDVEIVDNNELFTQLPLPTIAGDV